MRCVACPTQFDIVNVTGQCETCPEGSFPNGVRDKCFPCQANEIILYDGSCQRCDQGYVPSKNHKYCKSCPKHLVIDDGACKFCPKPETE